MICYIVRICSDTGQRLMVLPQTFGPFRNLSINLPAIVPPPGFFSSPVISARGQQKAYRLLNSTYLPRYAMAWWVLWDLPCQLTRSFRARSIPWARTVHGCSGCDTLRYNRCFCYKGTRGQAGPHLPALVKLAPWSISSLQTGSCDAYPRHCIRTNMSCNKSHGHDTTIFPAWSWFLNPYRHAMPCYAMPCLSPLDNLAGLTPRGCPPGENAPGQPDLLVNLIEQHCCSR